MRGAARTANRDSCRGAMVTFAGSANGCSEKRRYAARETRGGYYLLSLIQILNSDLSLRTRS
jgi:hypothetical protein